MELVVVADFSERLRKRALHKIRWGNSRPGSSPGSPTKLFLTTHCNYLTLSSPNH